MGASHVIERRVRQEATPDVREWPDGHLHGEERSADGDPARGLQRRGRLGLGWFERMSGSGNGINVATVGCLVKSPFPPVGHSWYAAAMRLRTLSIVLVLGACGGGDDGQSPGNPDAPGTPTVQFQPFTVRTRSLGANSSPRLFTLTDTTGAIACGTANDWEAGLGTQGSEIVVALDSFISGVCPTGTHSMHSNCTVPQFGGPIPNCAYYRRYDQQGKEIGVLPATAGAVNVSGNESSCVLTVNLSFNGQAFTDAVTLTNGLVANPWCR
ncbi:hypothetical protein BH11MYX3_BH11MYX3_05700 [soil metagenome]